MKLICAEYNSDEQFSCSVVGDNALLRNNNDFYFPDFTESLSCVPQVVLKTCKLGKGIPERFAHRYYNEIGVGIRFYADSLEEELLEKKIPSILASSFDESAAISRMKEYDGKEVSYAFFINEKEIVRQSLFSLPVSIDRFVSEASHFYMVKIGDYFFCGSPFRYKGIKIGDRLQLFMDEEKLLDFYVK